MATKVLVAYASVSGSTGEVAEAIGEVLGKEDVNVHVHHVNAVADVSGYRAVVLGSSIRAGKWLPEAFQFLETFETVLSQIPVAYFTTCLTMVNDTEESRRTVLAYMKPVYQKAPQIKPVGLGLFAGSLDPGRPMMIQAKGLPQGDYRNWQTIQSWAEEIRSPLLKAGPRPDEPIILRDAVLSYTDMSGADLHEAELRGAELYEADLSEANLHGANLGETDLIKADLRKADLHEADLHSADLNRADLSGANLSGANLIGADLSRANLDQANLSLAILNGANLSQANLSGANLRYADLNWANLSRADLSHADLGEANLGWANLSGTDLSHTNMSNARFNDQTEWPEAFSPQAQGCLFFKMK